MRLRCGLTKTIRRGIECASPSRTAMSLGAITIAKTITPRKAKVRRTMSRRFAANRAKDMSGRAVRRRRAVSGSVRLGTGVDSDAVSAAASGDVSIVIGTVTVGEIATGIVIAEETGTGTGIVGVTAGVTAAVTAGESVPFTWSFAARWIGSGTRWRRCRGILSAFFKPSCKPSRSNA